MNPFAAKNTSRKGSMDKILEEFAPDKERSRKEFNADDYANVFFRNTLQKEAPKKCNELTECRNKTEDQLKKMVFENYSAFVKATNGIHSMQSENSNLKRVLQKSQNQLSQLEKLSVSNAKFEIEMLLKEKEGPESDAAKPGKDGNAANHATLPQYVSEAPGLLTELLMERQYTEAVEKILRVQEFWNNLSSGGKDVEGGVAMKAKDVFIKVQEIAEQLASKLFKEVSEKHMQVWRQDGLESIHKAHKLLIDLGKAEQAVRAFTQERSGNIRRALRTVEVAGDTISYVRIITDLFFTSLSESCQNFLQEFHGQWPCSQLVIWVDEELAHYASLLGRQIRAARLLSTNFQRQKTILSSDSLWSPRNKDPAFNRRKSVGLRSRQANFRRSSSIQPDAAENLALSPDKSDGMSRLASPRFRNSSSGGDSLGSPMLRIASVRGSTSTAAAAVNSRMRGEVHTAGIIALVSDCLQEAFEGATKMKDSGMPVTGRLSELLVPELEGFIHNLEQIVRAANNKALDREDWKPDYYEFSPPRSISVDEPQHPILVLKSLQSVLSSSVDILENMGQLLDVGPSISTWCSREDLADLVPCIPDCIEKIVRDYMQTCMKMVHSKTADHKNELHGATKVTQQSLIKQALTSLSEKFLPQLSSWCLEVLPELSSINFSGPIFESLALECKTVSYGIQ